MLCGPGLLQHLRAHLPVPGMMEQHMLCFSEHPKHPSVGTPCMCVWSRLPEEWSFILPFSLSCLCRERAGVVFGTVFRVGR